MEIIYRLTEAESKLMTIIWAHTPIPSPELIKIAAHELGWKRTTTYTILKKICGKGIASFDNATVTAAVTLDEFNAGQSRCFVEDTFGGSLPMFIASFIGGGKLTTAQAAELRSLIEEHEEGRNSDG